MTFGGAFLVVVLALLGAILCGWYLWCWRTMLFLCRPMDSFFSRAYPTSIAFLVVNFWLVLAGVARVLVWLTN